MRSLPSSRVGYRPNGFSVGSRGVDVCLAGVVGGRDRQAAGAAGVAAGTGAGGIVEVWDASGSVDDCCGTGGAGWREEVAGRVGAWRCCEQASLASFVLVLRDSSLVAIMSEDTPARVLTWAAGRVRGASFGALAAPLLTVAAVSVGFALAVEVVWVPG